ncbi:MAG: hypothetical protein JXA25_05385 [Anaerolineales bacterium]|nr:hypothetical protein [Anaerolineales bacterium]
MSVQMINLILKWEKEIEIEEQFRLDRKSGISRHRKQLFPAVRKKHDKPSPHLSCQISHPTTTPLTKDGPQTNELTKACSSGVDTRKQNKPAVGTASTGGVKSTY